MALALQGTLVRLLKSNPKEVFEGRLYIADDGRIAAVKAVGETPPSGFTDSPVVDVGDAFVYPGLINLHSHLGYNALPLWTQPNEPKPFLHHDIWPGRSTYKEKVSWPAWVLAKAAPEALLVYVQVQALAGGTTTIQGWPSTNRTPANQLLRSADDQRFPDLQGGEDTVRTSTLTLDLQGLAEKANDLEAGRGFIYHCAEGQVDSRVVREFEDLGTANCLRQRLIAIHCNAIDETAFRKWKDRAELAGDDGPGAVVWSPFSNLWLYGQTTNIPAARQHGISVCLGSDWGPSGTKNLLGELKVARIWAEREGWKLEAFDLVEMVTSAPGDALSRCWGTQVGRLATGARADVAVLRRSTDDPWEDLVRAREEAVLLVLIDGQPRYGTKALMEVCGATRTTSVEVGEARRRIMLFDPQDEDKPPAERRSWTWSKALARLEAVRDDPIGAVDAANAPTAQAGRIPSALGPVGRPLLLELDMPGAPGMTAGPPPPGVRVDFEPIPSLRHDRNWRNSVKQRGFHEGILDALDRFYTIG
jgi:cytosine/adenosine deaminase-related metal-dependent hydrolase